MLFRSNLIMSIMLELVARARKPPGCWQSWFWIPRYRSQSTLVSCAPLTFIPAKPGKTLWPSCCWTWMRRPSPRRREGAKRQAREGPGGTADTSVLGGGHHSRSGGNDIAADLGSHATSPASGGVAGPGLHETASCLSCALCLCRPSCLFRRLDEKPVFFQDLEVPVNGTPNPRQNRSTR